MARTTRMNLIELMVLKQDINQVIEYLGKKGSFQFQSTQGKKNSEEIQDEYLSLDKQFYDKLIKIKNFLGVETKNIDISKCEVVNEEDRDEAANLISSFEDLQNRLNIAKAELDKVKDAHKESLAFSNLKVPYSDLEHLSFLTMKIGKIQPSSFDELVDAVGSNAVIIALGDDKSHIMACSSKKGRFALDTELKNFGFVEMEVPKDFKGVPDNVLESLEKEMAAAEKTMADLEEEKINFAETHQAIIEKLIGAFTLTIQINEVRASLEATELVYRITGWVPANESDAYMTELDSATEGRIAFRKYDPFEVPSVISGKEQVPVKLSHGKLVSSFERMIFSYGSPLYRTVDPTPFVALFFTILFGIMFGDLGQGLVFLILGILMACKVVKVGGWNKFAPVFMCIGTSSSIMGLLTGEFFSDETLLEPFSLWVTGLFGTPHAPIVKMMPSSDPSSIKAMFTVFGIAVAIGFLINSIGLIINLINNVIRKKWGEVFFGKNGLAGTIFFWYVVALVIRIVVFKHSIAAYDWIVIGISLFFASFGEPFERMIEGKRPVLENGLMTAVISGVVEMIEVVSGYLSNTVSFVRVGAFALGHAVLDFLFLTLTEMVGGFATPQGLLVAILGNALIVVLEGMIVAIQVIRLQYYEFFSKFFHETGREFKPFTFSCEN